MTLAISELPLGFYGNIGYFTTPNPEFSSDSVFGIEVVDPPNQADPLEIYVFAEKNIARFHVNGGPIASSHTQGSQIEGILAYKTEHLMIVTWQNSGTNKIL